MKTLVVSVVIAMTSVFNAFSNGNLTQFAYNTTTDGEKVESQTVYTVKNGKYLQQASNTPHGITKQGHTPIPEPKPCIRLRMPDKALII